jgi:hypothetical protein
MSTCLAATLRGILAIGAAAILTSLLPLQRAAAVDASVADVPTGPGSVLGAPNGFREHVHQAARLREWRAVSRRDFAVLAPFLAPYRDAARGDR